MYLSRSLRRVFLDFGTHSTLSSANYIIECVHVLLLLTSTALKEAWSEKDCRGSHMFKFTHRFRPEATTDHALPLNKKSPICPLELNLPSRMVSQTQDLRTLTVSSI